MKSILASIPLVLMLVTAPSAKACACCAEPGTWREGSQKVTAFERAELQRIRFDEVARLYLTAAGLEAIKGIENPSERYSIGQSRRGGRWTLTFRDRSGRSGMLSFQLPALATTLGVDLRDGRQSPGGGPLLYKEYRLEGTVSGTGIFTRGSAARPRFRLILHGRGNSCLSARDFRHWTLRVTGVRASYSFFGGLKQPGRG